MGGGDTSAAEGQQSHGGRGSHGFQHGDDGGPQEVVVSVVVVQPRPMEDQETVSVRDKAGARDKQHE